MSYKVNIHDRPTFYNPAPVDQSGTKINMVDNMNINMSGMDKNSNSSEKHDNHCLLDILDHLIIEND